MKNTHSLEFENGIYTVNYWDHNGVAWDLNAEGEPITSKADLIGFIYTIYEQGALDRDGWLALTEDAANLKDAQ